MDKRELLAELKVRGITVGGNTGVPKLVEMLNKDRADKGESPLDPDSINGDSGKSNDENEPEEEEKSADLVKVTMVQNVKHGVPGGESNRYEKNKEYELDEETAALFKTNGWAK